jgi:hypothetical protein
VGARADKILEERLEKRTAEEERPVGEKRTREKRVGEKRTAEERKAEERTPVRPPRRAGRILLQSRG